MGPSEACHLRGWLQAQVATAMGAKYVIPEVLLFLLFFLAHQHKAAGMKIKLSKNNDHDGILFGVKSA